MILESASTVGLWWLSVIPYYQPLRLSDFEVGSELHRRTLAGPSWPTCRLCGDSANFGHDEVFYHRRERHILARHNQVVQALSQSPSLGQRPHSVEPHTNEGRRRNDIRLPGSAVRGATAVDYDIKVYPSMAAKALSTTTRNPEETLTMQHAIVQCNKYSSNVGEGG